MIPYDILWTRLKDALNYEIKQEQKAIKQTLKSKDYSSVFALSCEKQALEYVVNTIIPNLERDKA